MYRKYIKRILDFFVALIVGIIALPICLIVALIIKLDSKGPAIFKQERTGYKGKVFNCYKFRTMRVETHDESGRELTHDERCTKIGNVIRKLSIDELPQLINILKGEMSLIGPRPWIPEYSENFTEEQKERLNALPGITGLAQANGRNAITIFDKINYDIEYTKNITFINDVKIIIATIVTVFTKHGAEIKQEGMYEEIDQLRNQFDVNDSEVNPQDANNEDNDDECEVEELAVSEVV